MQIIPAIDIIEGKCVRLTQGDYAQKTVYNENPLDVALMFEDAGIKRLHLVDLDGAKNGKVTNMKTLEKIATKTQLVIDFGGGIKRDEDIRDIFNAGASIASIGSVAVKEPFLFKKWIIAYGTEKIMLGADVKNNNVMISGWLEKTELNVFDFIDEKIKEGVTQLFCTDISKDGKLEGPATELYEEILKKNPSLYLIASGGVSNMLDLERLEAAGCKAAIVGKAIYEDRITIDELKNYIA